MSVTNGREKKTVDVMSNLDNYQKIAAKIKDNGVPVIAGLEVTYSCNLSCKHCYVVGGNARELDLNEYYKLIDDLFDLGTFCIVFTGGEPLVRKDFFNIAGYAKRKGFLIVLFTNGTLIDEETADKIKGNGFWKIEMSIYGGTAKTHDRITQRKGSFEKTLSAVNLLRERDMDVTLKTPLLNLNIHEYHMIKELAKKLGLNLKTDFQINPKMDGNLTPLSYRISPKETLDIVKDRDDLKYFQCDGFQYIDNLTCNAGKHILGVSPYGDVKPCIIFPVSCGNIKKTNIKEIWLTKNGILDRLRTLEFSDLIECPECEYKSYCIRCYADCYLQTGNILNASPASCELAELRYKLSMEKEEKS